MCKLLKEATLLLPSAVATLLAGKTPDSLDGLPPADEPSKHTLSLAEVQETSGLVSETCRDEGGVAGLSKGPDNFAAQSVSQIVGDATPQELLQPSGVDWQSLKDNSEKNKNESLWPSSEDRDLHKTASRSSHEESAPCNQEGPQNKDSQGLTARLGNQKGLSQAAWLLT